MILSSGFQIGTARLGRDSIKRAAAQLQALDAKRRPACVDDEAWEEALRAMLDRVTPYSQSTPPDVCFVHQLMRHTLGPEARAARTSASAAELSRKSGWR